MSGNIIYTLKWKYLIANVTSTAQEYDVFTENSFCDVTLVSDDQKPIKAHRYVLSTFSPVLEKYSPQQPPHPLIYLWGVNHRELDSILQCIYLGNLSVNHSNMMRFALAPEGMRHSCNQFDYQTTKQSNLKTHKQCVHKCIRYSCNKCDYQATTQSHLKTHMQFVHEGIKYSCNQCHYQATTQSSLKTHKQSVHEGVKYFCNICNYQTGWKTQLNKS